MQYALRACRASCNGHIKELEKKAQLSKKAENGERNEIQKLIAQLFADSD
jgi:ribosome recycling factor